MKWPLRRKLLLAFGSLTALVAVLGGITYERLVALQVLEGKRDGVQDLALIAEQLRTTMLQSRRHEKDFFARGGDVKCQEMQAQRYREFDDLVEAAQTLLGSDNRELRVALQEAQRLHTGYREAFASAAVAFQRRGTHESGLQKEFRDLAHEIEDTAKRAQDDELTILLLQMRRAEKDYLLRELDKYRDKAIAYAKSGLERAQQIGGPGGAKLAALFDNYVGRFEAAYQTMKELQALRVRLHDATEAVDSAIESFHAQADAKKREIVAAGAQVHADARALILVMFFATIVVALIVARLFSNQMTRSVEGLLAATQRVAAGDLTARVKATTTDELGQLADSFNGMIEALGAMSSKVKTASSALGAMVEELRSTVAEQGASIQQQAASVAETVATVEELARSSFEVSKTAGGVVGMASESISTSEQGRGAIDQSIKGMNDVREQVQSIAATILELSEKTQQIGSIIATVDDFAEQSSLLALNASIEAARAGEEGKAFSVVAGEVKNLAEQSRRATERVRSILSDIQRTTHTAVMVTEEGSKRVDVGVQLVGEAGRIIADLTDSILASTESAKQIAAAAQQQNAGIDQISVAIGGIDEFAKQNLDAIQQTESASKTLSRVTGELTDSTQRYQL